jgi:Metallo-beta-lactamase superfamily domain
MTSTTCLPTGKCHGITITPYAAGHTIGGTIWKIRSPSAGTLVYAVNLNHLKERHLDGSVLTLATGGSVFEPLARPDVLITDAERALTTGGRRKDRDKALLGIFSLLPVELVLTTHRRHYNRDDRLGALVVVASRLFYKALGTIGTHRSTLGLLANTCTYMSDQ